MKTNRRYYLSIGLGVLVLALLVFLVTRTPLSLENIAISLIFLFLIVFTTTFGVPFGGGTVSFLPVSTIAAFLVIDLVPAGWVAFLGASLHQGIRQIFGSKLGTPKVSSKLALVAVAIANSAIQTISILVGGLVYKRLGGAIPFDQISGQTLIATIVLVFAYMGTNLTLAGMYLAARSSAAVKMYLQSLPNLLLFEITPLIFLPLIPLIYTQLGLGIFILFTVALVAASLIARNLALTTRGLERRVQELDSLQIVGQALSASLRLDQILSAIYDQVNKLMPADNFYVALYYPNENEVVFPIAIEDGQPVEWRSRRAGSGLTEYILHSCEPLLITTNVLSKLELMGIEHIGTPAESWLGVPMMTGKDPLGVIVVQSHTSTELYDNSHKDILVTIAAQAAIAIQNARLYEQTDEALSRRVQELNSVLRTSAEGMLLLNLEFGVLAANRALADFLKVPLTEFSGGDWGSIQLVDSLPLLSQIGYTIAALETDCQKLSDDDFVERKRVVKIEGPPDRHLERTLTPVVNQQDLIAGWLLVFRDISEEIKLARLREDMAHMLVHDLRSPLTVLRGSFGILRSELEPVEEVAQAKTLIDMAERSTDRMMNMVNGLLDIAKLEDGQMPLYTEAVPIAELIEDVVYRIAHFVKEADIQLETIIEPDIPDLRVDPKHIRRVIGNILDNAIKFTPDGGKIQMWVRLDDDSYPQTILVGVGDSGKGISADVQKKLFQKFQTDSKAQGRRKGTGLGLAYCKLVVEAHGGDIWVESEEGKGATFIMRLPADQ